MDWTYRLPCSGGRDPKRNQTKKKGIFWNSTHSPFPLQISGFQFRLFLLAYKWCSRSSVSALGCSTPLTHQRQGIQGSHGQRTWSAIFPDLSPQESLLSCFRQIHFSSLLMREKQSWLSLEHRRMTISQPFLKVKEEIRRHHLFIL